MAKTCLMKGECWVEFCNCLERKQRDMRKKDEEVRVINRLYNQATKHGRGEEWYAKFLHFIKAEKMYPIEAAAKASREDEKLKEIYL